MRLRVVVLMILLVLLPYSVDGGEYKEVVERTIKIEGTVEKPRIIFIVPRARVWKEDLSEKSFINDILQPVYPERLVKEFKITNPTRR